MKPRYMALEIIIRKTEWTIHRQWQHWEHKTKTKTKVKHNTKSLKDQQHRLHKKKKKKKKTGMSSCARERLAVPTSDKDPARLIR